jgi:hypothetical protein
MRLIPRRKGAWALVLFAVAFLGVAGILLVALTKSDLERRFDQIMPGMSLSEAKSIIGPQRPGKISKWLDIDGRPSEQTRIIWSIGGESITLVFENDQLTQKDYVPITGIEKLRRLWERIFKTKPRF